VNQDSIERIRSATFPIERRGYDKREVERFLGRLADWLEGGGADQARSDLVKRELERIGEKTARILTAAEDAAEQLRAEAGAEAREIVEAARLEADGTRGAADRDAAESRAEADGYAERGRTEADSYAARVRAEADDHAAQVRTEADEDATETRASSEHEAQNTVAAARLEAKRTVEEGNRRRRDVEAVIADLEERREAVLEEMRRLSSELVGTATQHRPGAGGGPPGTAPSEARPAPEPESAPQAAPREL
jgi:DivIVA domain-containing protein